MSEKEHWAEGEENPETLKLLHKTIKKVTEDIEAFKFNTAISQMMIFNNHVNKIGKISPNTIKIFAKIVSPYAPHVAEELWLILGHKESIAYEAWPEFDESLAKDDQIDMAVQINGKLRDVLELENEMQRNEVERKALLLENVSKYYRRFNIEFKQCCDHNDLYRSNFWLGLYWTLIRNSDDKIIRPFIHKRNHGQPDKSGKGQGLGGYCL
jgi:leucyl-tRNA synthetase